MSEAARLHGTPTSATHSHATAATATISGVTDKRIYVTEVTCSSDKSGSIMLIKDGTTTIWQVQVDDGYFSQRFSPPLVCSLSADATATIDSTSAGKANINGIIA